jgi:beta-carotene 15,15'-dioxygenase
LTDLLQNRWTHAAFGLVALAALISVDKLAPHAGLIALVVLVCSVGALHGALDALLMLRHFQSPFTRWMWMGGYLGVSVATAWALKSQAGIALLLLLALSIWHFGEGFDAFRAQPLTRQIVYRLVRGGAPVLMPALIAQEVLQLLVQTTLSGTDTDSTLIWRCWHGAALAWGAVTLAWLIWAGLLRFGERSGAAACRIRTLAELTALAGLYALVSPLMAFALFFGSYHAAGHVKRVMAEFARHSSKVLHRNPQVWAALVLTLVLGLLLVDMVFRSKTVVVPWSSLSLRTVILALTAVSVPHVVLISLCLNLELQ